MTASIVRAGLDDLVWVIIVLFAVVAQIIKAGRKISKAAPPVNPVPPQRSYTAPEDEIRHFLESLTRPVSEQPEPVAPPPAPPPRAARRPPPPPPPPPPPLAASRQKRPPRPVADLPPAPVTLASVSRRVPRQIEAPAAAAAPQRPARPAVRAPRLNVPALRGVADLRQAILIREVLGPPLALRRGAVGLPQ